MIKAVFVRNSVVSRLAVVALMVFTSFAAMAQIKVSGTVTDEQTGDPLIGVTVLEKGTSNGIATDFDGNFSLTVEKARH